MTTRFLGPIEYSKIPALVGRYNNPIPTRFLAPIDCLKIPAQGRAESSYSNTSRNEGNTEEDNDGYVVFKGNIHGSAEKQSVGERKARGLLRPTPVPNPFIYSRVQFQKEVISDLKS